MSLLFGVVVMLFWAVPYMAGLCFQEQYQMFLFDTNYFWSALCCQEDWLTISVSFWYSSTICQYWVVPSSDCS